MTGMLFFYTIFTLPLRIGMNKPQRQGKSGKAKNEEQHLYCSTFMRKHCIHLILKWVDQKIATIEVSRNNPNIFRVVVNTLCGNP
ncbi:hypothetical protein SAMN03159290_04549 [Pseudomonas sp. NFACC13-1]|nr:hypothetical protein SAMN03159290_04549 [Pseudomonas sp. NFACC13-1]